MAFATVLAPFLRDKAGERSPCLHEQPFDDQRTSSDFSHEIPHVSGKGGDHSNNKGF